MTTRPATVTPPSSDLSSPAATRSSFRGLRALTAAGLIVGAAGVVVQALAGADYDQPVPPGVVVLAIAAALTVWVRWRWMPVVTMGVAVLALLNVVKAPAFEPLYGSDGGWIAIGKWLLLLGGATALACSLASVMRHHHQAKPRTVREAAAPGDGGPQEGARVGARRSRRAAWPRRLQIAALLVLAPVCAEYLAAYDDSTGDPVRLIGGLVIFAPLYGAPALLIRETARRAGLGWVGIVMLAGAFGLIEAGLVDQSLFSLDYRHIESWDDSLRGTFISWLGLSAYNALNFVGGHIIYSICAPIALVEALRPKQHKKPWLSWRSIVVMALLYVGASALVLVDSLMNEDSHASPYQLVVSAGVVGLLVWAAFVLGRRRTLDAPSTQDGDAVRPWIVFALAVVVAMVYNLAPPTWVGFAVATSVLVVGGALAVRDSRAHRWSLRQVVAVAAAPVLVRAVLSFTYYPLIGHVSALQKYGHSAALLLVVGTVCGFAVRAVDRQPDPPGQALSREIGTTVRT